MIKKIDNSDIIVVTNTSFVWAYRRSNTKGLNSGEYFTKWVVLLVYELYAVFTKINKLIHKKGRNMEIRFDRSDKNWDICEERRDNKVEQIWIT